MSFAMSIGAATSRVRGRAGRAARQRVATRTAVSPPDRTVLLLLALYACWGSAIPAMKLMVDTVPPRGDDPAVGRALERVARHPCVGRVAGAARGRVRRHRDRGADGAEQCDRRGAPGGGRLFFLAAAGGGGGGPVGA